MLKCSPKIFTIKSNSGSQRITVESKCCHLIMNNGALLSAILHWGGRYHTILGGLGSLIHPTVRITNRIDATDKFLDNSRLIYQ